MGYGRIKRCDLGKLVESRLLKAEDKEVVCEDFDER